MYSSIPWSEFLGLWEPEDPDLSGWHILFGETGFGKIATSPTLKISDKVPQEQLISQMVDCLDMAGISSECYILIRLKPWAHMKIMDRSKWLIALRQMKIPQTESSMSDVLMLSADRTKTLYFRTADHDITEFYLADVKNRT